MLALITTLVLAQQPDSPSTQKLDDAAARLAAAAERLAAAAERISPPPPPPPAEPAEPPKPDLWSGNVGANLTWVAGNVTSIAFVGNAAATRKSEKFIFASKAFGGYGEKLSTTGAASEVLLFNAGITAQLDYRFTPKISAFVGAGLDTDHVKSVELRGYGEAGVGVLWFDLKEGPEGKEFQKVLLKTDLSLRVQPETRYQYYPAPVDQADTLLVGPRLAANFRYSMTAGTFLQEDLEIVPNVLSPLRVLLNSGTKLGVSLNDALAIAASLALKYDSAPAPGRQNLDSILALGLEATF